LLEAFISLVTATALLLGSPGPAPLALAATGATYGVKPGIAFLIGILTGLLFAIVGATAGLSALFSAFPSFRVICQIIGAVYIGYVAFKIATAPVVATKDVHVAPTFKDGFILNILNPKAYAAFLAIFSQFLLPFSNVAIAYIATGITCFLVATAVDIFWLCFGGFLRPIFSHPVQAKIIRLIFAILMIGAVIYALV
tara:strand:+ start:997 stop:1587 length:591 start_codon:yes stop_codon:yes gene_type:complete